MKYLNILIVALILGLAQYLPSQEAATQNLSTLPLAPQHTQFNNSLHLDSIEFTDFKPIYGMYDIFYISYSPGRDVYYLESEVAGEITSSPSVKYILDCVAILSIVDALGEYEHNGYESGNTAGRFSRNLYAVYLPSQG